MILASLAICLDVKQQGVGFTNHFYVSQYADTEMSENNDVKRFVQLISNILYTQILQYSKFI